MLRIWFILLMGVTSLFPTSETTEGDEIDPYKCKANGEHFVIATSHASPFMIVRTTTTNISRTMLDDSKYKPNRDNKKIIHVEGFVHEIITWIAQKCNFTFEYVLSPDRSYGSFENGSWDGMVGMLVQNEVKMIAADLTNTYERSLAIEFTMPFSYDPIVLMIPYPELDSTISGIVKPYQYQVWIWIIISLFVASIFLGLVSYVESRNFTHSHHQHVGWMPHFWFLFRVLVNPDEGMRFTWKMRLLVAAWCLAGIVFVNAYTSSIVSYLMAPRFVPLINTLQDLADSDKIQLVVRKSNAQYSILMDATSGPLAKLGAFLRANPENILSNNVNLEDKVYNQHLASPHQEYILKARIYKDFQTTGKCRLSIAKEPFYPNQCAFATAKTDPMAKVLSDELLWLSQMGLLDHWITTFLPPPYQCSAPLSSKRPGRNERLSLNYLSSAFLLYGVGVVASVVAFFLERLFGWWRTRIQVNARPTRATSSTIQHIE